MEEPTKGEIAEALEIINRAMCHPVKRFKFTYHRHGLWGKHEVEVEYETIKKEWKKVGSLYPNGTMVANIKSNTFEFHPEISTKYSDAEEWEK